MKVEQQVNPENRLSPFAVIGRVVVFAFAFLAVCALVKPFVNGRICENCPCPNDGESAGCSIQAKPTMSA